MSETTTNTVPSQMASFIGTKRLKAFPMTKKEYCEYRGWEVPSDEDPDEQVYLVEYEADPESKPNHPDHEGYISMSPKHVFDKAYKISESFVDRLVIEHSDLKEKKDKMWEAIKNGKVPGHAIDALKKQSRAMTEYLEVLEQRIGQAQLK